MNLEYFNICLDLGHPEKTWSMFTVFTSLNWAWGTASWCRWCRTCILPIK